MTTRLLTSRFCSAPVTRAPRPLPVWSTGDEDSGMPMQRTVSAGAQEAPAPKSIEFREVLLPMVELARQFEVRMAFDLLEHLCQSPLAIHSMSFGRGAFFAEIRSFMRDAGPNMGSRAQGVLRQAVWASSKSQPYGDRAGAASAPVGEFRKPSLTQSQGASPSVPQGTAPSVPGETLKPKHVHQVLSSCFESFSSHNSEPNEMPEPTDIQSDSGRNASSFSLKAVRRTLAGNRVDDPTFEVEEIQQALRDAPPRMASVAVENPPGMAHVPVSPPADSASQAAGYLPQGPPQTQRRRPMRRRCMVPVDAGRFASWPTNTSTRAPGEDERARSPAL